MKTFVLNCPDDEIRQAVVEWSELLAQEKYAEALAMFLHTSESFGFEWTPEHLEDWVSNYGCARKDYDGGKYYKITSLQAQPNSDQFIRKAIKINREHLRGADAEEYVGDVMYDDVPLDGKRSDLTARFNIKKVGADSITLEFVDIHVM
jgi:hypothetical protein